MPLVGARQTSQGSGESLHFATFCREQLRDRSPKRARSEANAAAAWGQALDVKWCLGLVFDGDSGKTLPPT